MDESGPENNQGANPTEDVSSDDHNASKRPFFFLWRRHQKAKRARQKKTKSPEHKSADANHLMARFTGVLVIVNIAYVLISSAQLVDLGKQNDSQRRQLRPYIDVSIPGPVTNIPINDVNAPSAVFQIIVSGQTPPLNVIINYHFEEVFLDPNKAPVWPPYVDSSTGSVETFRANFYQSSASQSPIIQTRMANGVAQLRAYLAFPAWFGASVTSKPAFNNMGTIARLALVGDIAYSDGFGSGYNTPFCFIYLTNSDPRKCKDYQQPN